jgi:hypothetical protein
MPATYVQCFPRLAPDSTKSEESSADQFVTTASDAAPAEAAHLAHERTLEQAYCFRSGHRQGSFRVCEGDARARAVT